MIIVFIYLLLISLLFNKDINKSTINNKCLITENTSLSLKAICSFMVIMQHLAFNINRGNYLYIFEKSGKYAVAVFFFLSAYGIFKSIINNKNYMNNFIKKRLTKI